MPKSDTWPGGIRLETMTGVDSAGSCDSVVSNNSTFSDDSLEYLSAEEKACLMFLEETLESLDTEDDSGLSTDELDQLPSPGSLATRLADLSASMSRSVLNGSQNHNSIEPKDSADSKLMQSYLVPTPFVLASSSNTKLSVSPDNQCNLTPSSHKLGPQQNQKPVASSLPLEIKVVMPPATTPRDVSVKTTEGPLPRGPLSYDALVYLRRSASSKRTPLCPTVDHTIDSVQHPPVVMEAPAIRNQTRPQRSHSEDSRVKVTPPAVAPKPKKIPACLSAKLQTKAAPASTISGSVKNATDPNVVRLEALQKLGLLKDKEPGAPQLPSKPHPCPDPTDSRFKNGQCDIFPSNKPSSHFAKVPMERKTRLQSSASFHHSCGPELLSTSCPSQIGLQRSTTFDHLQNEPRHVTSVRPVKTVPAAQPVVPKPSNCVGYTVMMVPGMGADRKEALRKLGLLKDS